MVLLLPLDLVDETEDRALLLLKLVDPDAQLLVVADDLRVILHGALVYRAERRLLGPDPV